MNRLQDQDNCSEQTRRKKYLFVWELGAGFGHISLLTEIARQLHPQAECTLICKDLRTVSEWPKFPWARVLQAPTLVRRDLSGRRNPQLNFADLLHNIAICDPISTLSLLQSWRSTLELIRPDCIVASHGPIALLVAQQMGIKTFNVGTGFTAPPVLSPFPEYQALSQPNSDLQRNQLLQEREATTLRLLNESLTNSGFSSINSLAEIYQRTSNLICTAPQLDIYESLREIGSKSHQTGYFGSPIPKHETPNTSLRASNALLLAYLRPSNELKEQIAALKRTKLSCITVVPGISDDAARRISSKEFQVTNLPVDTSKLTPAACVNNGSHAINYQMIQRGIPSVWLPMQREQQLLSEKLEHLKLGLTATFSSLATTIERIIEHNTINTNCRKSAELMQGTLPQDPAKTIAETISSNQVRE